MLQPQRVFNYPYDYGLVPSGLSGDRAKAWRKTPASWTCTTWRTSSAWPTASGEPPGKGRYDEKLGWSLIWRNAIWSFPPASLPAEARVERASRSAKAVHERGLRLIWRLHASSCRNAAIARDGCPVVLVSMTRAPLTPFMEMLGIATNTSGQRADCDSRWLSRVLRFFSTWREFTERIDPLF